VVGWMLGAGEVGGGIGGVQSYTILIAPASAPGPSPPPSMHRGSEEGKKPGEARCLLARV
jgi:hypothetical protein